MECLLTVMAQYNFPIWDFCFWHYCVESTRMIIVTSLAFCSGNLFSWPFWGAYSLFVSYFWDCAILNVFVLSPTKRLAWQIHAFDIPWCSKFGDVLCMVSFQAVIASVLPLHPAVLSCVFAKSVTTELAMRRALLWRPGRWWNLGIHLHSLQNRY